MYTLFITGSPVALFTLQLIDVSKDEAVLAKQWFAFPEETPYQLQELIDSEAFGGKIDKILVSGPKKYMEHYVAQYKQTVKGTGIKVEQKEVIKNA